MKVIGFDSRIASKITCGDCGAIIEFYPIETKPQYYGDGRPSTDEGTHIYGFDCPNCRSFVRTNP